jgi:signal transduction histidine kinase
MLSATKLTFIVVYSFSYSKERSKTELIEKLKIVNLISRYLSKWQIKVALAIIGVIIVVTTILFSIYIVNQLIEKEQRIIETYSHLHKKLINPELENIEEVMLLMDSISPNITFPIVMTNEQDSALFPYENYSLNIEFDKSFNSQQKTDYIQSIVASMKQKYPPVEVRREDGSLFLRFYYTNSNTIELLKYFPIIAIATIVGIILIGYLAFSNIRRNEEQKVWVGMAKEAAHQLGTPISGLSAWIELLRLNIDNPQSISETVNEMQKDIARLNTVANRFSKIGSSAELSKENIVHIIDKVSNYFEKRLPHIGRKVEIFCDYQSPRIYAMINYDLFAWVIENLIKNATEAIEVKHGEIRIAVIVNEKSIEVTFADNGKGMSISTRKQVFLPGYTTKKRGWGLGLSLCKRIVEDYHKGKLYVKETNIGKGTTFAIELPIIKEEERLID